MTDAEAKRTWETFRRWRENPAQFVHEEFNADPDEWQQEVLRAFPHEKNIIMKACKGPGKTAVLSWCAWNFLATRPNPRIGATSITQANLDSALWPEMAKWQQRSPFLSSTFQWSKTQIVHRRYPATWWMQARSWPKKADAQQQADALGGLHEDYAMWILDEMGGYPQALMATIEAVHASGVETKIVGAGNPTHTTGPLYRACTIDRTLWFVVTISADPDDPKRTPRVSLDHARNQIRQYGRDNPWVLVNIFGQFPPASINALLGVEEVEAAMKRHLHRDVYEWAQKRLGVDVARFGDDRTVIFPRQGLASFRPIVMRHARGSAVSVDIAARIMKAKRDWGSELELIDDTVGWAHGVIDQLVAAGVGVMPINYAGKALDPRYRNRRAEMWMRGADKIRGGAALPYIPEMIRELTEPTYTFVNGQFLIEPKDLVKDRLGESPDLADGYMITHAIEDLPGQIMQRLSGRQSARRDADPYALPGERDDGGRADRDGDP